MSKVLLKDKPTAFSSRWPEPPPHIGAVEIWNDQKTIWQGGFLIFDRMLSVKACSFNVLGIGYVWIQKKLRGQGLGSLLMEEGVAKLRGGPYAAAVLYSADRMLYRLCGFHPIKFSVKKNQHLWAMPLVEGLHLHPANDWELPGERF